VCRAVQGVHTQPYLPSQIIPFEKEEGNRGRIKGRGISSLGYVHPAQPCTPLVLNGLSAY
jgi:hypothetical protein